MKQRNFGLDLIRGVAICFTLMAHFSLPETLLSTFGRHNPFWSGVEIFFIISGINIGNFISEQESTNNYIIESKSYLLKRIYKCYPSLIVVFVFSFILNAYATNAAVSDPSFITNFTALLNDSIKLCLGIQPFLGFNNLYVYGPLWYIGVMIQAWALTALFLICFSGLGKKLNKSNILVFISIVVIISSYIGKLLQYYCDTNINILLYLGNMKFDFICMGIIVSNIIKSNVLNVFYSFGQGILRLITILLCIFQLNLFSHASSPSSTVLQDTYLQLVSYPIALFTFSIMIVCLYFMKPFNGTLEKAMLYIGKISYSCYVFNAPLLIVTWFILYYIHPSIFSESAWEYAIGQILIGMPLILLIGTINYKYVEQPISKKLRKGINC